MNWSFFAQNGRVKCEVDLSVFQDVKITCPNRSNFQRVLPLLSCKITDFFGLPVDLKGKFIPVPKGSAERIQAKYSVLGSTTASKPLFMSELNSVL